MASLIHDLSKDTPGVVLDDCVTAQAAADITGYNIQHIRRLALAGTLDAYRVGHSWLIKLRSLEVYLAEAQESDDRRFGPRVEDSSQQNTS